MEDDLEMFSGYTDEELERIANGEKVDGAVLPLSTQGPDIDPYSGYTDEELERIANSDRPSDEEKKSGSFFDGVANVLRHKKLSTEAQYGRDLSVGETVAASLPFVGSLMDANEARKERVEQRLWNGEFNDPLEASKLALSIGIPEDKIWEANAEYRNGNGNDSVKPAFASLVKDALANRIATRNAKGEELGQFDLNFLQETMGGAMGLAKVVPEMANLPAKLATWFPSTMNRAASLQRGQWDLDENGNPVQVVKGDDPDKAMLKGGLGAAAERAIWSKLPGTGKLAKSAAKNVIARNAVQIGDMVVKSDLTDLVDTVMGLGVPEAEANKTVSEWAAQHLAPKGLLKDVGSAALLHGVMKGVHYVLPSGFKERKTKELAERDAQARQVADEAIVAAQRAADAAVTDAERNAHLAEVEEAKQMKATQERLASEDTLVAFMRNNEDLAADIISARRRGEDVDMGELLADSVTGIDPALRKAFQSQEDANAFGDRLLLYAYDDGLTARQRESREQGLRVEGGAVVPTGTGRPQARIGTEGTERLGQNNAVKVGQNNAVQIEGPKPTAPAAPVAPTPPQFNADAITTAFADTGKPSALKRMVTALRTRDMKGGGEAERELREAMRAGKVPTEEEIADAVAGLGEKQAAAVRKWVDGMKAANAPTGTDGADGTGNGEPPKPQGPTAPTAPTAPTTSAEPPKTPVDASAPQGNNEPPKAPAAPTEAELRESAYQEWLATQKTKGGRPKKDSKAMRMQFDLYVEKGKVKIGDGVKTDAVSAKPVETVRGDEATVEAPKSVEDGIAAMPYGKDRLKAQYDYLVKEIAKANEGVKSGKSDQIRIKVPGDGEFSVHGDEDGIARLNRVAEMLKSQVSEYGKGKKLEPKFKVTEDRQGTSGYSWTTMKDVESVEAPPSLKSATKAKPFAEATKDIVSKDKKRTNISRPFVMDGYRYATDGRVLVRVPAPGEKNTEGAPSPELAWKVDENGAVKVKVDIAKAFPKIQQALVAANEQMDFKSVDGTKYPSVHSVELWMTPEGELAFRSAGDGDGITYQSRENFKGCKLIGVYNGKNLEKVLRFHASQGDGVLDAIFARGNKFKASGDKSNAETVMLGIVADNGEMEAKVLKEYGETPAKPQGKLRVVKGADGKARFERDNAETKPTDAAPQATADTASPSPSDAAFRAWAVDRDGKPLAFATKEDEARSRAMFNDLVKQGKVDGETGKWVETKTETAAKEEKPTAAKPEPAPSTTNSNNNLESYLSTKKPFEASRIKNTLTREVDFGDGVGTMTEAELIDRALADGTEIRVDVLRDKRGKVSKCYVLDGNAIITKTAFDYAKHRGVKIDENSVARADEYAMIEDARKENQSVRKPDYSPSDEDIQKRIDEISLHNFSYRKDIQKELAVLNKVKAARIARNDWSVGVKPEPAPSAGPKTETAKPAQSEEAPAPSAPSTVPQELRDRGIAALRKLKGHEGDSEAQLLALRKNLVRAKRADMVQAVDDLLAYKRATANQRPLGLRDSRTVEDVAKDDPGIVAKIAERLGRLVPGIKVRIGELSDEAKASGAGAQYDRKSKEALIPPDASAKEVVHEICGHAVRQWAEQHCPQLFKKALDYAMNAPKELKEWVYENYADRNADGSFVFDGDALLDEIFAHRFAQEHGELFKQMLNEKPKVKHWWANITNAVRSVFADAAKKNGVDLEGLRGLGAEEYVAKVAEQLAAGKELNEWTAYGKDKEFFGKGVAVGEGEGTRNSISRRAVTEEDDRAYADAVKRGDKETALRMIREAAAKGGYTYAVFHGTNAEFTKFQMHRPGTLKGIRSAFFSDDSSTAGSYGKNKMRVILKMSNPFVVNCHGTSAISIKGSGVLTQADVDEINKLWGMHKKTTDDFSTDQIGYAIQKRGYYDGVIYNDVKDSYRDNHETTVYEIFNNRRVKSADITYDDAGNLIPLSQRFNADNPDIRYSRRDRDAASPYDERTEDGRKFNEKYGNARTESTGRGGLGRVGDAIENFHAGAREGTRNEGADILRLARENGFHLGSVEEGETRYSRLPFGDGETEKHGMETVHVYRDNDGFVYKYRRPEVTPGMEMEKVRRHNALFGDRTKYEVVGLAETNDGRDSVVVKQPYIDLMPKSGSMARKQLEADLRKRFGAVEVKNGGIEMHAGDWVIDDLKDGNIGIDRKNGKYAVVDALVHRKGEVAEDLPTEADADGEHGKAEVFDARAKGGDAERVPTMGEIEKANAGGGEVYGGASENDGSLRYSRSTDLDRDFPGWNNTPGSTQISSTVGTYKKLGVWFRTMRGDKDAKRMKILDASSGLGYGSDELRKQGLNVDDVEPYQTEDRKAGRQKPYVDKKSGSSWESRPATYDSYEKVPDGAYDLVVSNAVLNVIPDDWRADVLRSMAAKVRPGGTIYINVLPKDYVSGLKNPLTRDEALAMGGKNALDTHRPIMLDPQEALARNAKGGSYQRGFSKKQMEELVHEVLGEDWVVKPTSIGMSGVLVTRPDDLPANDDGHIRYSRRRGPDGEYADDDIYSISKSGDETSVMRDRRYGVGKDMMGKVYFHKDYAEDVVPKSVLDNARKIAEREGFVYNTMMYDPKTHLVRFDESPDFDTAREPHPGNQLVVNEDGTSKRLPYQRQIFHHKWMWVKDDYDGFDVGKSKEWSRTWLKANAGKGAPSGWMEKWNERLAKIGLPLDEDGSASENDGSIRYSRTRHPAPTPASSALMDKDRTAKEQAKIIYMRNMADRYYDVKDVVRDTLVARGWSKEDAEKWVTNNVASPYHSKRVQSGMAEKDMVRLNSFIDDFASGLKTLGKNHGLDLWDAGIHAYGVHAPKRNAQKLKDHGIENGAGISDDVASAITTGGEFDLNGKKRQYTAEQLEALEEIRKNIVHRGNEEFGLKYLHDAGLIDASSVKNLRDAYGDDYVSFMDDMGEDGVDYGASTSVANPLKKAHGRTSELTDNPIVSTIVGWMSNIVNAKKNASAEAFAKFVEQHPEMGEVRPMTPADKMDPSRIVFRRNVTDPATGKEKNVKMLITLYGKRGVEVAKSFTDADLQRGPGWMQNVTRMWASFATQLSPTFSVRNLLKDTVEVTMDTLGTQGVGAAATFLKGQMSMMPLWNKEFRNVLKEWRKTGKVTGTSQLAQDFREFVESGALIGGLGREGYGDVYNNLTNATEIKKLSEVKKLSDLGKEEHVKALSRIVDWYTDKVGAMNEAIEVLTRFNNFRNRRAHGEDVGEAAINSREGSTDFGMYGNQRWTNSVWMFSNSILGGTMRAAKTLTGGKYGRRLMVGMVALGILEEMANAALNDDDESEKNGDESEKNITEYDRENSFRLRIGGKMVKIPAHFGPFSVLKYAGNNIYRAMAGQISAEEAAKNVGAAAVKVVSHLTGTGEHGIAKDDPKLIASLMPTAVVQPLVQTALNEDYKGDKIAKEHSFGPARNTPDWRYAKATTGKGWVELSRIINNLPLTGGSDVEKGALDIAPEKLKYLTKQIFKNFGTDVYNTAVGMPASVFNTAVGDEKFDTDSVPFFRDVVKDAPNASRRYYDAVDQHAKESNAFKLLKTGAEKSAYLKEHPTAAYKTTKIEDQVKKLMSLSRGEIVDKNGKVIGNREISAKMRESYERQARKVMAQYLKLLKK